MLNSLVFAAEEPEPRGTGELIKEVKKLMATSRRKKEKTRAIQLILKQKKSIFCCFCCNTVFSFLKQVPGAVLSVTWLLRVELLTGGRSPLIDLQFINGRPALLPPSFPSPTSPAHWAKWSGKKQKTKKVPAPTSDTQAKKTNKRKKLLKKFTERRRGTERDRAGGRCGVPLTLWRPLGARHTGRLR